MDGNQFDLLTRSLRHSSRRGFAQALAGPVVASGFGAWLHREEAGAKKRKRKKKKCKGGTKKCGKRCISASTCCTNPDCGSGGACIAGACMCLDGFKTCQGECIPNASCCTDSDCPHEGVCVSGACVAPVCAGHNECGGTSLRCEAEGTAIACFCLVLEGSGDPFCGQAPRRSTPCSSCTAEERCVNLTGCGDTPPTGCALPCPDPR